MKKMIVLVACMVLVASAAFAGVQDSKHDLGVGSGSGGYVAVGTTEICVFCHTPHGAQNNTTAPLWNRSTTASVFTLYASATMTGTVTPGLTGASLACMSCHDGTLTIAGSVINDPNLAPITAGVNAGGVVADLITGFANLTNNLSNDHPVNVQYSTSVAGGGFLAAPTAASGAVLIGTQVECASCHQVHDNTIAPFLRGTMARSALCLGCHVK
ncbi:MAG: cytochrome c3 family protein [Nitrospirota bacterium]